MNQVQPRIIIWTTLVVLQYTMLYNKFQGHWSIGSEEEEFFQVFLSYMGMAAILVTWPRPFEQLFFPKGCYSFQKTNKFPFLPSESLCAQIWPWRNISQGQPRIIILTNLVVLTYTMLHTKFQGHWSIGSGEEEF